ncbi:methylamine utilization protein [Pseudomonas sp.]|uniref:methylamine utilization protein n=1 Tax=Pseudomonas sp. TaxID=306 RepID=UPI003568F78E
MSKRFLDLLRAGLLAMLCSISPALWAASLQAELVDAQGQPLAGAVLTLRGPLGAEAEPLSALMDQQAKQFVPNVLAVRSGTRVAFPNSDNIRHHVYSFSPTKRFELRLYQGTPSEPVLFDKPGAVVLGCNIHDWMVGYVYVTDDPWFAVSDAQGKVQLDSLPVGSYAVSLWHPQAPDMLPQAAGTQVLGELQTQQRFTLALQASTVVAPPQGPASAFGDAFKNATRDAAR